MSSNRSSNRYGEPAHPEWSSDGFPQGSYNTVSQNMASANLQQGYQQEGYQQGGYQQGGYQQGDYQQGGYQQGDYQQGGYQQGGYHQGGYQQGGYPQGSYHQGDYWNIEHSGYGLSSAPTGPWSTEPYIATESPSLEYPVQLDTQDISVVQKSRYVCYYPTCGQKFGDKAQLKRHETIHTEEPVPCRFCGGFVKPSGLRSHIRLHSVEGSRLEYYVGAKEAYENYGRK